MKKTLAIAALAAITFAAGPAPANAQMTALKSFGPGADVASNIVHKTRRRRGRRIAAGIALGILGAAAIASHSSRSHYYEDRYSRHERRCRRWNRWCRRGDDRACYRFDTRC